METSPTNPAPLQSLSFRVREPRRVRGGIGAICAQSLAGRYVQGGAGAETRGLISPGRILRALFKTIVAIHVFYIVVTSTLIIAYRFVDPPATVLMPYRTIGYGWKLEAPRPLPIKTIPGYLKTMLVAVEDGKFYEHFGLDFDAFKRARQINAQVGRPLYGGSTLTMQVARTLFLVPEKSYIRKYFEVITALELEIFLPKDRILELYFGYAEWGKGIFGIDAAARHWYGKGVSALTRDQGARLIALLSSPIRYNPDTLQKSGILRERYAYLVRRFVSGGGASVSPDREELPPKPLPSPEPGVDIDSGSDAAAGAAATGDSVTTVDGVSTGAESGAGDAAGASVESPTEADQPVAGGDAVIAGDVISGAPVSGGVTTETPVQP